MALVIYLLLYTGEPPHFLDVHDLLYAWINMLGKVLVIKCVVAGNMLVLCWDSQLWMLYTCRPGYIVFIVPDEKGPDTADR